MIFYKVSREVGNQSKIVLNLCEFCFRCSSMCGKQELPPFACVPLVLLTKCMRCK